MSNASFWFFLLVVALALGLGLINGWNDAANSIAAAVCCRAMSPRSAVILAGVFNAVGTCSGLAVARTIGKGILIPDAISYQTVIAGLGSIVIWGIVATFSGLPISLTHGLLAGLAAAGMVLAGGKAVVWSVLVVPLLAVIIAPLLGFIAGFLLTVILVWLFGWGAPSKLRVLFGRLQWLTVAFLSYSHGLNDGQMPVGTITMALVLYTGQTSLWDHIPWWVIAFSALSIGVGTAMGGWKVIRTVGMKITSLEPVHGFASDSSSALVATIASIFGIPISTTHVSVASIMGIGASRRLSAVRWGVAGRVVAAWILTFPLCGGLGFILAWMLKLAL